MKNFILILSVLMLVKPVWPVVEYILKYDYIISVLCENKDKPELECNGKCYLSKKLAEENGSQEDNPSQKTQHSEIQTFLIAEKLPVFQLELLNVETSPKFFGTKPDLYTSIFIGSPPKPPRA
ncbi:MAG: hypothetical protein GX163_12765 [Bacteroidetes bacterium]|nr:hypothetical protein [Bacteroidota bacterium]